MTPGSALGRVYRCPVCGVEVMVIHAQTGALDLWCCNRPMEPVRRVPIFRCPVCGAEVAVLRQGDPAPDLVCCGRPMELRQAAREEASGPAVQP